MSFIQIPIQIYPNTSLGYSSLSNLTSGTSNTAFGYESLKNVTTGFENVAVGNLSLRNINTGYGNTAVGNLAISTGTSITNSTAVGAEAMRLSIVGANNNTAIGNSALRNTLTGANNTAVGYSAGYLISTGSKNTVLGAYSGNQGGLDIRTLSNYVVISDGDGNPRIIVDPAGLVSAPGGFSGGGGGGALTFNNQTAAYTVVSGDLGKIVNCTSGTFTVSLTAAATLGSGFNCWVWNTGTGVITIDPSGAETIDGVSTLTLRQGEGSQIVCNGINWETGDRKTMRGYAENLASASARPSASGASAVAIGSTATASGISAFATNNSTASGTQSIALGGATATSNYSTSIGQNSGNFGSQAVTGTAAMALGGSYASGIDSFAAAIANNTVTYGARASNSIAMGDRNQATNGNSTCVGGQLSTAGGGASLVSGTGCSTGTNSFGSVAVGNGATNTVAGKFSFAGTYYGSTFGTAQMGMMCLSNTTPGAAATVLTSNGGAASTVNQLILPDNTAHAFSGIVVARQKSTGGTQSAAWSVSGLIRREAGAGTTTLVASTVTVISNVPGWTLALSADTVNGGLSVTATGAAATDIRWHVKIDSSEVTYT